MTTQTLQVLLAPGRDLGASGWVRLPQDMLTHFEALTLSNDPMHTDPAWVRQHTHYTDTIAPGFLTMSLLPALAAQVGLAPPGHVGVNYGFDRLRWPAPVPVGAEVRGHFRVIDAQPRPRGQPGAVVRVDVTIEVRDQPAPGMVATWLVAMLPDRDHGT